MSGTTEANRINARQPRRLKLTSALIATACVAIRAGVRPQVAFALNGVPSSTYKEWMGKATQPDPRPILRELIDSIELAVAEWEAADILLIGQSARQENPGEWTAAAWRLERRLPSIYAKKTQKTIDVVQRPFIDTTKLTLPEQHQLLELLRKGAPEQEQLPDDGAPAVTMLALTAGEAA